jgi:hypothetical protein
MRDARVLTLRGSAEAEPWQLVSMLLTNLTVRTDVDPKHSAYPETLSRSGIPNPRVHAPGKLCRSRVRFPEPPQQASQWLRGVLDHGIVFRSQFVADPSGS